MARKLIEIAGDKHLETLRNCGGYYETPRDKLGRAQGPLVGSAGRYDGPNGQKLQFVGEVYANFAKAEVWPHIMRFFAQGLANRLEASIGLHVIDVFCGAPIGGYSLAAALGMLTEVKTIKAEKQITALATADQREQSELVFARHTIERHERVVIVEDVCNNFSTTDKLIRLIQDAGGTVVAIASLLNRSLRVDCCYFPEGLGGVRVPVISLVRKPIPEWRQGDPEVAADVAADNVVWKPKDEWPRLMQAMEAHS